MIFFQKIWCDLFFPYFCTPKINAPVQKVIKREENEGVGKIFWEVLARKRY